MSASTEWSDNSGTKRDTGTERPSNGTQIKWLIENSQNTPFSKIKYYWCFVLPLLPERPVLIDEQSRFRPLQPWRRTKHASLPDGGSVLGVETLQRNWTWISQNLFSILSHYTEATKQKIFPWITLNYSKSPFLVRLNYKATLQL